ncbi:MAG: nitrate reductase maturation protein NarM [Oscillatoriales cyanobacterium SM2_2_1]|nr:nitrate reductase maturation protein NarM [Oscillatoriales cyanobacterium SM2_2_1]
MGSYFFAFEQDFVTDLRCIPMAVRYKLDRAGLKLKLLDWQRLSAEDRQCLCALPGDTTVAVEMFARKLLSLVPEPLASITEVPLWEAPEPPEVVRSRCERFGYSMAPECWQSLALLQRYALYKLCRSHHEHEHRNLPAALREFGLVLASG